MAQLLNVLSKTIDSAIAYNATANGSSFDVSGCSTVAVQTVLASVAGGSDIDVILQHSIDGSIWYDLDSDEAIATASNVLMGVSNPVARYMRVRIVVNAGSATITTSVLGKGMV